MYSYVKLDRKSLTWFIAGTFSCTLDDCFLAPCFAGVSVCLTVMAANRFKFLSADARL